MIYIIKIKIIYHNLLYTNNCICATYITYDYLLSTLFFVVLLSFSRHIYTFIIILAVLFNKLLLFINIRLKFVNKYWLKSLHILHHLNYLSHLLLFLSPILHKACFQYKSLCQLKPVLLYY